MADYASEIHAFIVDDEEDARLLLRDMISEYLPHLKLAGQASSIKEAYQKILRLKPGLVFLDIQLEDGTGFELLEKFPNPSFHVIVITAFDEFALKAFNYSAVDYLLKPFAPEKLVLAVEKAERRILQESKFSLNALMENRRHGNSFEKIVLPSAEGLTILDLKDIVRIEAEACYSTFFTVPKGRTVVTRSIKYFEEMLPPDAFFRIHTSHIINFDYVRKFLKEEGGYALMSDGSKIPVARRRKDEFVELLKKQSFS